MTEPTERREPLAKSANDRVGIILALAGIVLGVLALFFALQHQKGQTAEQAQAKVEARGQAAQEQAEKVDLAQQVQEACQEGGKTARALGSACNQATQIVKGDPGDPGLQGPPGPPPSDAQVQNAVALYCADGRCKAASPTAAQVSAAVATYCNANGECRGRDGADSTVPGPGPTDSKVAALVADYCSTRNECKGSDGETPNFSINTDGHLIAKYPNRTDDLGRVVGKDGDPATPEQVTRAVATYCDSNGGCKGEKGDPPDSFTFTDPGLPAVPGDDKTYTCTDPDGDGSYACT